MEGIKKDEFESGKESALRILNGWRILIPIFIGLGIILCLMWRDKNFSVSNFALVKNIKLSYLFCAILTFVGRNFFYTLRIRLLSNGDIPWRRCLVIILLWEFLSCITPSVIGGGVVAVFLFMAEGIPFGRAMAYVMATTTLDNYFFLLNGPLGIETLMQNYPKIMWALFIFCYCIVLVYASIMTCALYFRPRMIKWVLYKITSISILKRFRSKAEQQGNEMIAASKILVKKGFSFWMLVIFVTLLAWYCRYIVLNFLIASLMKCSFIDHLYIFRNHLIMWVSMLLSPTPGGAGFVELIFTVNYTDLLTQYTPVVMFLWRLLTFYIYIFCGTIIIPFWVKNLKKKKTELTKK